MENVPPAELLQGPLNQDMLCLSLPSLQGHLLKIVRHK